MTHPRSYHVDPAGKLPPYASQECAAAIRSLAGKQISIKIWESPSTSSERQRKYYFDQIVEGFIRHFASEGKHFTSDQMHDVLMRAVGGFANPYVNPFTGEPEAGRISYNSLTRKQAEGYHTLCRQRAAVMQFDIPEPNETVERSR